MAEIKKIVFSVVICPNCRGELNLDAASKELVCASCGYIAEVVASKAVFTEVPPTIQETEFRQGGEGKGHPWRQANWGILKEQIDQLPGDALVLDVGSGRGDFASIIGRRESLALDIYPYPEVDVVCDLTQVNPFRENSFDTIVLMNVLEHVFATGVFLSELAKLLKSGGRLLVAIPFLLKVHQAPFDFVRYTQFSLEKFGEQSELAVD